MYNTLTLHAELSVLDEKVRTLDEKGKTLDAKIAQLERRHGFSSEVKEE